ncbi:serine protease, partial [Patescibacteria group bacterium]|nr:serine protease [Patescibacteria group bacterium]
PISGSGVMITKNGIILTNAHVGQYFLLRDYLVPNNVDCTIRTGSPAVNTYRAELLYLPPAWIDANASQITAQEGMGTGQYDYAFLRITAPTDASKKLPESFPAITMTTDDPTREASVLLAAYPAGFLSGMTISTNLYISTVLTQISEIFAFDSRGDADLVSLGASIVAQAGSSGGGVLRQQDGALQALIATETETASSTSTNARNLHAITLGHIDRSLREAGLGSMAELLSGDPQTKAADFAKNIAPGERKKLIDALNKR